MSYADNPQEVMTSALVVDNMLSTFSAWGLLKKTSEILKVL